MPPMPKGIGGIFCVWRFDFIAVVAVSRLFARVTRNELYKNKKPRPKPRKNRQNPLTNGEEYDKMIFHTVGVCHHGILAQHGYITTDYGGCQDTSL